MGICYNDLDIVLPSLAPLVVLDKDNAGKK